MVINYNNDEVYDDGGDNDDNVDDWKHANDDISM